MDSDQTQAFRPERLRLARLLSGMTLDDLGEKLSNTRQFMHQLETGKRVPNDELQGLLSTALGVERNFLHERTETNISEDDFHFRKRQTTPRQIIELVKARGIVIDSILSALEERVDLPTVDFLSLTVNSVLELEQAAENARLHWGLGITGPITNMTRVLENAGAVVTYFKGISEKIDALSIAQKRPLIVRNDDKGSACRLRFDLAHECAHLIIHQGVVTGDPETEAQANRFASAFLLPRKAFLQEFPRSSRFDWTRIIEMKLRWKVSIAAIIRRAFDLGVIDAYQYRSANIYISKNGYTRNEPGDDRIQIERAEVLSSAFDLLVTSDKNALKNIREQVGLSNDHFMTLTNYNSYETDSAIEVDNIIPFRR
jgi:Zn-dependent peptidase ImmA (M78 family)/DNA-binding XRE family transcriptional regulator